MRKAQVRPAKKRAQIDQTNARDRAILADQVLGELHDITKRAPRTGPNSRLRFLTELTQHCVDVVDATAVFLSHMTKDNVSLSVKFLWEESPDRAPVVHGVLRSANTRPARERYEPADYFPYSENTAFASIVQNWNNQRAFASNNLFELAQRNQYHNANRRWRFHYASTAVTPIPCAQENNTNLIGFLCADSLSAELDQPRVISILEVVSDHINQILISLITNNYSDGHSPMLPNLIGWKNSKSGLQYVNHECQHLFQAAISDVEWVYRAKNSAFESSNASSDLRRELKRVRGELEMKHLSDLAAAQNSLAAKTWLEDRALPEVSDDEASEILRRMARYNPAAKDAVDNRH